MTAGNRSLQLLHGCDAEVRTLYCFIVTEHEGSKRGQFGPHLGTSDMILLPKYLAQIGLEDVRVTARFDCFGAASKEKAARKYGVHG